MGGGLEPRLLPPYHAPAVACGTRLGARLPELEWCKGTEPLLPAAGPLHTPLHEAVLLHARPAAARASAGEVAAGLLPRGQTDTGLGRQEEGLLAGCSAGVPSHLLDLLEKDSSWQPLLPHKCCRHCLPALPAHPCTPQELAALLCSPNLEGYLRPGCVHLTLEALLQARESRYCRCCCCCRISWCLHCCLDAGRLCQASRPAGQLCQARSLESWRGG